MTTDRPDDRAERAEAEVERLEESLSLLLWELTGGLLSKTNYDVPTMVREIEDYFERTEDNAERDQLRAQVAAVRALHQSHACTGYPDCTILFGGQCAHDGHCNHCRRVWPCPTIRKLGDAGGEQP